MTRPIAVLAAALLGCRKTGLARLLDHRAEETPGDVVVEQPRAGSS